MEYYLNDVPYILTFKVLARHGNGNRHVGIDHVKTNSIIKLK